MGVPSGAAQVIAIAGRHFPKLLELSSGLNNMESREPDVMGNFSGFISIHFRR
jgi:hypothetical protein